MKLSKQALKEICQGLSMYKMYLSIIWVYGGLISNFITDKLFLPLKLTRSPSLSLIMRAKWHKKYVNAQVKAKQ